MDEKKKIPKLASRAQLKAENKVSKSTSRTQLKAEKSGRTQNFKPPVQSKGPGKNKV